MTEKLTNCLTRRKVKMCTHTFSENKNLPWSQLQEAGFYTESQYQILHRLCPEQRVLRGLDQEAMDEFFSACTGITHYISNIALYF